MKLEWRCQSIGRWESSGGYSISITSDGKFSAKGCYGDTSLNSWSSLEAAKNICQEAEDRIEAEKRPRVWVVVGIDNVAAFSTEENAAWFCRKMGMFPKPASVVIDAEAIFESICGRVIPEKSPPSS